MKTKYILTITILLTIFLIGCQNNYGTTNQVEFDLEKAREIHRTAWEPVYQMVDEENIFVPSILVKSFDEFMSKYGFNHMTGEAVKDFVFCDLINGDANNPQKDSEGYIIFGNDQMVVTADNLINEDIYVAQAYIETRYWKESDFTDTKLVIVERSRPGKTRTDGFERLNYFEKNDEGEWILTNISGNGISLIIFNPDGVDKN